MPCKDHPNWKWFDDDNECCTACGALRPVVAMVSKKIDITHRCVQPLPPVKRESMQSSIDRCNRFLGKWKGYIQQELGLARTMKDIYNELSANYIECPSRSWLVKNFKKVTRAERVKGVA